MGSASWGLVALLLCPAPYSENPCPADPHTLFLLVGAGMADPYTLYYVNLQYKKGLLVPRSHLHRPQGT